MLSYKLLLILQQLFSTSVPLLMQKNLHLNWRNILLCWS